MIFSLSTFNYQKIYSAMLTFTKKCIGHVQKSVYLKNDEQKMPSLEAEIAKAYEEWKDAQNVFEEINDELIDYAVFRLNAAERRYMYLLNQAKRPVNAGEEENVFKNCKQSS